MQQLQIFGEKAHSIKVSPDGCDDCGSKLLTVTFNKVHLDKLSLGEGETSKTACLACDELFNSCTTSGTSKVFFRRSPGKGKGKGKGKKGGGKGRGGRSAEDEAEERGRKLAGKKK